MKKHAIIPIFITHLGCPHLCVFCDQRRITAKENFVTPKMAEETIKTWLTTLEDVPEVEISFYGGSFTAIPISEQNAFLSVAKKYKDAGLVQKIHLSTRPDCINSEILDNLKAFSVDIIELGVQSFSDEVLRLSERGHDVESVFRASKLIKEYGFTLGIQLMVGLPGDTYEACVESALKTVEIAPEIARIYPTVTIRGTKLYDMYEAGDFVPLSLEEAVSRSKAIYEILDDAGINVIRVGLKSSDIMGDELGFHPAFKELVTGRIARDKITKLIDERIELLVLENPSVPFRSLEFTIMANERSFGNIFGHAGVNREYFNERYKNIILKYEKNNSLRDNEYRLK